jgi:hypothetical protein
MCERFRFEVSERTGYLMRDIRVSLLAGRLTKQKRSLIEKRGS